MLIRTLRFVSLSLMGLGTGISFSHTLQWSRKAELPPEVFARVQTTLYNNYGPVGRDHGARGACVHRGNAARGARPPVPAALTAVAVGTVVAKLPVWAVWIKPINEQALGWNPQQLPPDWAQLRDLWHRLHLLRFALSAAGTAALLAAVLTDTQ